MVLALVLMALLLISLLYNAANFLGHDSRGRFARAGGPRLDEVVTEDNDAINKIAVIEVEGVITGKSLSGSGFSIVELIKAQLKRAQEDDQVKAVILKVDSPGGEVLASDEIARAISDFQDKSKTKPVVAAMGSLAASGGYYVSAPCRWIVANEMTITGSIGVILSSYNYRGLMDKVGVLPQTYKSGKFKDMLSPSREPESISAEEKAMVQGLIDETYSKFKSVVQKGRDRAHEKNKSASDPKDQGEPLRTDWRDFADGRVLSGTEAIKHGFVDQLGTFEDAVERAKKIAHVPDGANLIQYQQRFDLSDLLRLFGKSDAKATIKVDLGMELPKLEAGKLYFLSPTFLQ
jgi:protease-4